MFEIYTTLSYVRVASYTSHTLPCLNTKQVAVKVISKDQQPLVRVKNILWRISLTEQKSVIATEDEEDDDLFHFGQCSFDIPKRKLLKNNIPIKLTKAEYDILVAFVANPSRVLSRERLLNLIEHRVDAPNDRTIDVLVRRLRHKIEENPKEPQIFTTIHGEGYLFAADIT